MSRAWIAFGANLGDRAATLGARESLLAARGVTIRQRLAALRSRPEGGAEEPAYVNAVLEGETALDAAGRCSVRMQSVEEELGRPAGHAPGPRTCDLDLLACDDLVVDEAPGLVLPHPRLHRRAFVLVPLWSWIRWRHPVSGATAGEMLAALPGARGGRCSSAAAADAACAAGASARRGRQGDATAWRATSSSRSRG